MRVLVVGSGGREHALVWKLAQEAEVFATPGNPGIAQIAECFPTNSHEEIVALAKRLEVDLVVVGPEQPLIDGLADLLRASELLVFGPSKAAAALEGSKAFSKELMAEAGVPTAAFQVFTQVEPAVEFARKLYGRVAVKASGAALGKGVVVCQEFREAEEAITMMLRGDLGEAGRTVVVEERLVGSEFSLLTICSEGGFRSLPIAQDYKRIHDGDRGPNTGGMGSYSPVPWISDGLIEVAETLVVAPMLHSLKRRGTPFSGLLFSGLMLTDSGLECLEYNVRFGDPETQSILPRLGKGFLDGLFQSARGGEIGEIEVLDNATVTVVVASEGYPGAYAKGDEIIVGDLGDNVHLFHAGTSMQEDRLVTSGGRVCAVTAVGGSLAEAHRAAYAGVEAVQFRGRQFRADIAQW